MKNFTSYGRLIWAVRESLVKGTILTGIFARVSVAIKKLVLSIYKRFFSNKNHKF